MERYTICSMCGCTIGPITSELQYVVPDRNGRCQECIRAELLRGVEPPGCIGSATTSGPLSAIGYATCVRCHDLFTFEIRPGYSVSSACLSCTLDEFYTYD